MASAVAGRRFDPFCHQILRNVCLSGLPHELQCSPQLGVPVASPNSLFQGTKGSAPQLIPAVLPHCVGPRVLDRPRHVLPHFPGGNSPPFTCSPLGMRALAQNLCHRRQSAKVLDGGHEAHPDMRLRRCVTHGPGLALHRLCDALLEHSHHVIHRLPGRWVRQDALVLRWGRGLRVDCHWLRRLATLGSQAGTNGVGELLRRHMDDPLRKWRRHRRSFVSSVAHHRAGILPRPMGRGTFWHCPINCQHLPERYPEH
mmetsp:Transcript_136735/g.308922  ORF Transcript_136735/g.308922 Transcript_136735/m.308922 type:complete len:256 (-) Transcript_136735:902-1669(-)